MAERSVARLAGERLDKRVQRWERIVREACPAVGAAHNPSIGFAENLRTALQSDSSDLRLLLWEGEKQQGLRAVLERSEKRHQSPSLSALKAG